MRRIVSTVGQFSRAERQGIRIRSARGPSTQPRDHFDRHVVEHGERDDHLVELLLLRRNVNTAASSSSFSSFINLTSCSATPKLRPDGGLLARDVVEHALDFLLQRGRGDRQQPGAHGVLGAAHQVAQALHRQVEAQAEDLDQLVVVSGAGDDAGIAGLRKLRAGIVREPAGSPWPSPRSTITSVTSSGRLARPEIASR